MMKEGADCIVDYEMVDVETLEVAWKCLLEVEGMNQISNRVAEILCCLALREFPDRTRYIALMKRLCNRQ